MSDDPFSSDRSPIEEKGRRLRFPLALSGFEHEMKRDRMNAGLIVLVNVLWIGLSIYNADVMWAALLIFALFFTVPRVWRTRARLRSLRSESLWVEDDTLFLPLALTQQPSQTVSIERLTLIEQRLPEEGDAGGLRLGTESATYDIEASLLVEPSQLPLLTSVLVERVCREPGGRERLVAGRELERERRYRYGRRPRVTFALALVIVVVHTLQLLTGAISQNMLGGDPFELIRMGANVPYLLLDGAWERAVTATFMHGGWIHLVMNGIALLALGGIIENTLGSRRLVVVYGVSALAASYASSLWSGALLSVGASGAIFGLLGALAVVQLRHSQVLAPRFRQSRRWWIIILIINGALPALIPQIDFVAHGIGLAVGALTTLIVAPRGSLQEVDARVPSWITAVAALLTCLTILALSVRATGYFTDGDYAPGFFARAPMESPQQRESLNAMAWTLAIDDNVNDLRLKAGRSMMQRLVVQDGNAAFRDTLATLWFRTGHSQTAAQIERGVLVESERRFMASQVLRFLASDVRRGPDQEWIKGYEKRAVTLRAAKSLSDSQTGFWGVFDGEQPYGLMRATGPIPDGVLPVAGDAFERRGLVFIFLGAFTSIKGEGTPRARFWRYDPEVDDLPPKVQRPRP